MTKKKLKKRPVASDALKAVAPRPLGKDPVSIKLAERLQEGKGENTTVMNGWAIMWDKPIDRFFSTIQFARGAFDDAIADATKVKILWQHDHRQVIGRVLELEDREQGLWVEFEVSQLTQQGGEAISLVGQSMIDGLSIGFNYVEYTTKEGQDGEKDEVTITKADLDEISVVTWPADSEAVIAESLQNGKDPAIISAEPEMTLAERLRVKRELDSIKRGVRSRGT